MSGASKRISVRLPEETIDAVTRVQEKGHYPSFSSALSACLGAGCEVLSRSIDVAHELTFGNGIGTVDKEEVDRLEKLKAKERKQKAKEQRQQEQAEFEADNPPPVQCPDCGAHGVDELDEELFVVNKSTRMWTCYGCSTKGEF